MPDPVLREWVKQCLEHPKGNDAPLDDQITDANLWQHTGDVLNLSDIDHAILTPDSHRAPSYDNNWPADQDYDNPKHPQPDIHDTGTIMHPGTINDLKGLERFSNLQSFTITHVNHILSISDDEEDDPDQDPITTSTPALTREAFVKYLQEKKGLSANLVHFEIGGDPTVNWDIPVQDIIDNLLFNSPKLSTIKLTGLGLTGNLPTFNGFSHLNSLYLSDNNLSGEITQLPPLASTSTDPDILNRLDPNNNLPIEYYGANLIAINNNQFYGMLPKIPNNEYIDYSSNHFSVGFFPRPNDSVFSDNHGVNQELTAPTIVTTAKNPDIMVAELINATISGVENPQTGNLIPNNSANRSVADDFKVFAYLGDLQSQSLFKAGYDENGSPKLTVNKNTPSGRYTLIVIPKNGVGPYDDYFYSANITFTLDNQMNPRPVTPPTPVDPGNPDIPTSPTTPTVPVTPAPQPSDPTPVQPVQPAPSQPTPQPQTAGQGDHGTTATKPGQPAGQGATITPQRPRPTTPRPQRSHPRTVAPRRTSRHATALTRSSRAPQSVAQLPQTNESTAHRLQLISLGLLTLTGALLWRKRS